MQYRPVHTFWAVLCAGLTTMTIDPWEKAAECDRAIRACDADRILAIMNLKALWLALGNEMAAGMPDWRDHAKNIDKIHADIMSSLH
jgi:hypothetical protein